MSAQTGTNLTADNNVPAQTPDRIVPILATAGQTYYRGQTVAYSSGLAIPVPANDGNTNNSALRVIGQVVACPSGAAVATDVIQVRYGVLAFNIQATDAVAQANCGSLVYCVSDNEVCATSTNNPKAGILLFIESGYAYVLCTPLTPS